MEYTSEIRARILQRDREERAAQSDSPESLCSHRVVSVPNGQEYGRNGHVPSDHYVEFLYMNGALKHVRSVGSNFVLHWFNGPVPV